MMCLRVWPIEHLEDEENNERMWRNSENRTSSLVVVVVGIGIGMGISIDNICS